MRQYSVTGTRRDKVPLPEAREISNAVHRHEGESTGDETPNNPKVSQMLWAYGQFIAHDIIKTPEGTCTCELAHETGTV